MTDEELLLQVLAGDAPDTEAGRSALRDVDRIRRGMELVAAAPTPAPALAGSRRSRHFMAAALAAAAAAGVLVVATQGDAPPRDIARPPTHSATSFPGPSLGFPPPQLSLPDRVARADRVLIGTVTAVRRDRLEGSGTPYVIAAVAVTQSLKPQTADDEVLVLAYEADGAATAPGGPSRGWAVGDEVLLFLVSDVGTVTEDVRPPHLQVADGEGGRYFVRAGVLDAPFTLDEVRRLTAR
jgi:hypothetical protein